MSQLESLLNKPEFQKLNELMNSFSDTVVVASASSIKIDSVQETLTELFPDRKFNIVGVPADSEINDQPINDETFLGAQNRIKNAALIKKELANSIFISIENGIFESEKDKWEDKAVVIVRLPNNKSFTRLSDDNVEVPSNFISEAKNKNGGLKENTYSRVMSDHYLKSGIVIDKQDPQTFLTEGKLTRKMQIKNTIKSLFLELLK